MNEELEFSISQYVDGTLPPAKASALEERLATDVEARELLAQYRKLDGLLAIARTAALPANVRWDRLASHISAAVDRSANEEPASYPMPWLRFRQSKLAFAACVLIALGLGVRAYLNRPSGTGTDGRPQLAKAIVEVDGPRIESSNASPISEVAIGPADHQGGASIVARYADGVVARPSRVVIASGLGSSDVEQMPY
jgi:hypothetical protein